MANEETNPTHNDGKREGKEKLAPVPKPNEKEYKDRVDVENKAINDLKAKINALQQRIGTLVGGRDEYNRKKQEMRAHLDDIQAQVDKYENERKTLMTALDARQKEGREMKQSVQEMKRKLGFSSVDEVDKRIAALEHSMMTNTLSLKEEKQLLDKIKQLKQNKPLFGKFAGMESTASSFEETSVLPLRTMLDGVRTKLLELRALKRDEQEKYAELVQQRQLATAPGRELIEERDKLSKQMNEHVNRRRAIQEEFKKENWKYQAYLNQQRQERNEKLREERLRRQAEQERANVERQLELVEEIPVDGEAVLLSQAIAYIQKIINDFKASEVTKLSGAEEEKKAVHLPKGEGIALLPKGQRDDEYFFAPKSGSLKKKGEGKTKTQKPKCIKHDIGTLSYFEQCGVEAPVCEGELEPCLNLLKEKLRAAKEAHAMKAARGEARKQELQKELKAIEARIASQFNRSGKLESLNERDIKSPEPIRETEVETEA